MQISIALSGPDQTTLKNEGFALYGFKAVKTAISGGAPLVWFSTTAFLPDTKVIWEDKYEAFISDSQIIANGKIDASNHQAASLGQIVEVSETGELSAATGGSPGAISITNMGTHPYTTGIAQVISGNANPMCAIPLHGKNMDEVMPIQKVLLMFASNTVNTGVVIYKCFSSGILIDLTGVESRAVKYGIDTSWDVGAATWAQKIEPNANLVPLLIT